MSERAQITLQAVIVVGILAAAAYGIVSSAQTRPPPIVSVPGGPDASLIARTARSPSPLPTPSPAALRPGATPSPTPTPRPPVTRAYAFGGRSYTGVELGMGSVVVAPYDGRLELHVYQFIDGEPREFTDAPGIPKYPYVEVVALDGRRMRFRPGALGTDSEVIAREGQLKAGDDLFRVIGEGRSSWREFYDGTIVFQMVVSLVSAGGADLDATPLIRVR